MPDATIKKIVKKLQGCSSFPGNFQLFWSSFFNFFFTELLAMAVSLNSYLPRVSKEKYIASRYSLRKVIISPVNNYQIICNKDILKY